MAGARDSLENLPAPRRLSDRTRFELQVVAAVALADLALCEPEQWPALTEAVRRDGPHLPRNEQSAEVRSALWLMSFLR